MKINVRYYSSLDASSPGWGGEKILFTLPYPTPKSSCEGYRHLAIRKYLFQNTSLLCDDKINTILFI